MLNNYEDVFIYLFVLNLTIREHHLKLSAVNIRYVLLMLFGFPCAVQAQTHERLPCIDKKFSIVAHIVIDNEGNAGITPSDIAADVAGLNGPFSQICASFEVCEYRYISNSYYDTIKERSWDEMQALYNVNNRINIYYVGEILEPPNAAGFAGLGCITQLNSEGIVVKKGSGSGTLTHEMGHYFGLYHTFEGSGTELADGSNCATAGDLVCDTPADPFVKGEDLANYVSSCVFISEKKDANGRYYDPMVGNIMSYYGCSCKFTHGQYMRMAQTYLSQKGMW